MIGLAGWVEIISAVLKFPDAVLRLIQVLKKTPEEQHQAILEAAEAESSKLKLVGRPTWD